MGIWWGMAIASVLKLSGLGRETFLWGKRAVTCVHKFLVNTGSSPLATFLLNPCFLSTCLPPFFSQLGPFPPGSPPKSSMTRKLNRFVTGSYCSAQGQVARAHGSFKLAHRRVGNCAPCVYMCVCVHTCACMLKEEGGGRGRTTEYQELSLHKEIKREYFPEQLKPIS